MKQKRFELGAADKGKEPLFCKMILTYFYEIYERVHDKNKEKEGFENFQVFLTIFLPFSE